MKLKCLYLAEREGFTSAHNLLISTPLRGLNDLMYQKSTNRG
jgi:hypothetical protein